MKRIVNKDNVENQIFSWGQIYWLCEPRYTGTKSMEFGFITINGGEGHDIHTHDGADEILYVVEGEGVQTIYEKDNVTKQDVKPGDLIYIPADVEHSTFNKSKTEKMVLIGVYQKPGTAAALRETAVDFEPPKVEV